MRHLTLSGPDALQRLRQLKEEMARNPAPPTVWERVEIPGPDLPGRDRLEIGLLHRAGGDMQTDRHTTDFIINGVSLFAATGASQSDLCGRFARGDRSGNRRLQAIFMLQAPDEPYGLPPGEVAFFVCPECGDLECGAVRGTIARDGPDIVWSDFTNSLSLSALHEQRGPFHFPQAEYEAAITRAAIGVGLVAPRRDEGTAARER